VSLVAAVVVAAGSTTYAHFSVSDPDTGVAALLHATPDDDPIAGEQSIISFDFSRTGHEIDKYDIRMTVRDEAGKSTFVPLEIAGNVAMAKYTFTVRGLYRLDLDVVPKDGSEKSELSFAQRVSRGTVAKSQSYGWPQAAVILAPLLLAAVLIVAFNNKERIIRWSKAKFGKAQA
jgi:hypothetical protein